MVLRESVVMGIAGILLGLALTFAIHQVLLVRNPTLLFEITQPWIIRACVIAFLGTVVGAAYPAFLAARKDPIDALAYE